MIKKIYILLVSILFICCCSQAIFAKNDIIENDLKMLREKTYIETTTINNGILVDTQKGITFIIPHANLQIDDVSMLDIPTIQFNRAGGIQEKLIMFNKKNHHEKISIDIIFKMPNMTKSTFQKSLQTFKKSQEKIKNSRIQDFIKQGLDEVEGRTNNIIGNKKTIIIVSGEDYASDSYRYKQYYFVYKNAIFIINTVSKYSVKEDSEITNLEKIAESIIKSIK